MYAPLFSSPLLSSKLDSPVIKILERHSLKLKKSALQATAQRYILKLLVTKLVL